MSDVSKIKIGSTSYNIADKTARQDLDILLEESADLNFSKGITSRSLTNISTSSADVRYAFYTYQRVGNFVTLNIRIQLNASTGSLRLKGLPFSLNDSSKMSYGSCVSDQYKVCLWTISYDSNLSDTVLEIRMADTGQWAHNSGESVNFIATYEV